MNKKLILVVLLTFLFSGCSLSSINKENINSNTQKNTPKTLLYDCCKGDEDRCSQRFDNRYKLCPNDYEKKCEKSGGSLKIDGDLASGLTIFSCYKSAPDADKACANDSECVYTCNLNNGIIKNLCNLIKSEENKGDTIEIYDCSTDKPGACNLVPIDYNVNCGGYQFELNGKRLKTTTNNNDC